MSGQYGPLAISTARAYLEAQSAYVADKGDQPYARSAAVTNRFNEAERNFAAVCMADLVALAERIVGSEMT